MVRDSRMEACLPVDRRYMDWQTNENDLMVYRTLGQVFCLPDPSGI